MTVLVISKFAVQLAVAVMVTAQSGSPVHPVKKEPELACAVNSTPVPPGYVALQLTDGQSMPDGALLTDPEPVPAIATVTSYDVPMVNDQVVLGGPKTSQPPLVLCPRTVQVKVSSESGVGGV